MRTSLIALILVPLLLTACASKQPASPSKHLSQSGSLKVHPGLLGQPVPAELQEPGQPPAPPAETSPATPDNSPGKLDPVGLQTQRSVYFDYKQSAIKTDYESVIQRHGRHLTANPNARIRIEGHADERGSAGYNNQLGLKRADAVRQALIAQGAGSKQVSVRSYGESRPKLTGHDEESWAENRRADIIYEREE